MLKSARIFEDERGTMVFDTDDCPFEVEQSITTWSKVNVLRGLHCSPYKKLVTCRSGRIFDVIVSPAGEVQCFMLKQGDTLLIEANYAHGYYCLEDSCVGYLLGGRYVSENEKYYHWRDPFLNIPWPLGLNVPIVSARDQSNPLFKKVDVVVLGASGYLGQHLLKYITGSVALNVRLEDTVSLTKELSFIKPSHVISAAGISGKPTKDWCETHIQETLFVNVTCQLNLMETCRKLHVHLTILGSGGVYSDGEYSECDAPNACNSVSRFRVTLESFLQYHPEVLFLRVHFPITCDGHEKCLVSKLRRHLQSIKDTMVCTTVVPSLFPLIPTLLSMKANGIFNFVNDGAISLANILRICGVEDFVVLGKASRPETLPSVEKLKSIVEVPTTQHALECLNVFE